MLKVETKKELANLPKRLRLVLVIQKLNASQMEATLDTCDTVGDEVFSSGLTGFVGDTV
jgi:hypothetical protein